MRQLKSCVRQPWFPWAFAGVVSLFLSLLRLLTLDVINPDGICYLQSAETVMKQHTLAMQVCEQSGWPFYQVLIGGLSLLTDWQVSVSAGVLDSLLSLVSVLAFVAIVYRLSGNRLVRWLGIATILLAHHFNAFRADVIRDHGYWAFYLVSLYCLIRFQGTNVSSERQRFALGWSTALVVATLFRLEGIFFLVLLPCWVLLEEGFHRKIRLQPFLELSALPLVMLLLAGLWLLWHPVHSLGRIEYLVFQLTQGVQWMMRHWTQASSALGQYVLNGYSARDASLVLALALSGYYIACLLDVLTIGYFVLAIYAFAKRRSGMPPEKGRVLLAYVMVNFLITAFFLAQNFFLARRYLMAMALTLMFWIPFALRNLIQEWPKRRWPLVLAVSVILVCAAGGIVQFGTSKKYVREAGNWLALHAAPSARLYSNERAVLYYSRHAGEMLFASQPTLSSVIGPEGASRQYDWLALRLDARSEVLLPEPPVCVFQNARGDQVRIYHVNQEGL